MKQLLPRTITASVLAVIVISLLIVGKVFDTLVPLTLLLGGVTLISSIEYFQLMRYSNINIEKYSFVIYNVGFIIAIILLQQRFITLSIITIAILWPLIWHGIKRQGLKPVLVSWFGLAYIPLLLQWLAHLYNEPNGLYYLFFLLFTVWAYDIAAYFAGSIWGREKLLPEVSPGKTWEGALGGFLGSLAITLSAPLWMPSAEWSWPWILIPMFLSIATQIGDLFESWMKRVAHVKDAGEILPGHGGFLDRIDGLLFAAPVVYVYFRYVLGLF